MDDAIVVDRLAAARAGDQQGFSDLVEPYRSELLVHCYRLLASNQDAEDMVQETFLRAWHHLDSFAGGQYFRAWLYKIATNICLDELDKRTRRVLSPARFPQSDVRAGIAPVITEPIWIEPFPDERLPEAAPGPEARYTLNESISLAFLAALQFLPPRQRVILILCDVLDWPARDVAGLMEITIAAVNGLLRRARATMKDGYPEHEPVLTINHQVRAVLEQYVAAWESGDVGTLIALLTDKVVFSMPPSPTWYAGVEAVSVHAKRMFSDQAQPRWRLQPTRANNRFAFACYRREYRDGVYYAHSLHVLTIENTQIAEIHAFFFPQLFPRFGMPTAMPS
jgi:RNA polymerase sigma-70 factor, ECF subfamily